MKRTPFKPRTWWTLFHEGVPLPRCGDYTRRDCIKRFVEQFDGSHWEQWEAEGYTVGKIVVSPHEGK